MSAADDFLPFVEQVKSAVLQFVTGASAPLQALWSHGEDVTLFGGLGDYELGWPRVSARLDWAATRVNEGQETIEPLAMGLSRDLAYTVWLEKGAVRYTAREELSRRTLRVTQIYRYENDTLKIIHRHADAISEKSDVPSFLLPR